MKANLKIARVFLIVILSISFAGTNAQTTLFTEDWETAAIGQTPPAGWGIDLVAGTNHIKFDSAGWNPVCSPFSGSRLVEFQSYTLSSACSNRLKRTIPVSTIGYPYVSVDFEWHSDSSLYSLTDRVEVQWSTNGTTWNTTCTVYRATGTVFDDWVPESIGLPAGAANQATLYIAFLFSSDQGYNCHLDLVHIKGYSTAPAAPTVNTTHATAITTSSATLNGYVNANGNSSTGYFQYGLTTSYGNTLFFAGNVTGSSLTPESVNLINLAISTTYHFRLVAFNAGGITYGNDSVFTTSSSSPPTVITNAATNISNTGATLNGHVNANGTLTTVTFQYGLTSSYGTTVTWGTLGGSTLSLVSKPITGLTPSTTYHYRCVGSNSYGTTNGNDTTFTTLPSGNLPSVTTTAATSVTNTSAYLNGLVNGNGFSTTVSFQYGLTTAYGTTLTYGTISGNGLYNLSKQATGLSPSTTYHYRCVGTNSNGTTYGNDTTFITLLSGYPPDVITDWATNITPNTARLNGEVNANGYTTTVTFQYGLTPSYGTTVTYGPISGNMLTPVHTDIYGLSPATLYHYRCVGVNAYGTTYGNDTIFTTLSAAPTVTTGPATNINYTTATLTGTANANGLISTVTFEYGLTASYGSTVAGVPYTINGSTPQNITANLTGLTSATVYHFRIKGINADGISYGYDTTFTTLDPGANPPIVTTTQATSISAHQAVLGGIVNANGSATTTQFEYGTTTAYGSTIPAGDVYGNTNTPISATAYSLTQGTLYHFRAVGSNAGGISYGADSAFTTNDSVTLCHASYTYDPHLPDLLTIYFFDLSTGNIVSWNWSFGDPVSGTGNFSTLKNPTHYFSAPGTYNVCLTVQGIDSLCHDTYCYNVAVDTTVMLHVYGLVSDSVTHNPIPNHPIIIDNDTINGSFYAHHRIAYSDNNGIYNDTIILPASVIPWRFIVKTYDGNHNQLQYWTVYSLGPPEQEYDFPIYSCENPGCDAHFIAYPDSTNPLTYHFIDQSGGNITSWYWSFGDGTHSFDRNPTHTFLHWGEVHHVCHTVVDSVNSCCDVYCTDITPGYPGCQANFYFYSDSTGTGQLVHFFDISTGNPTQWMWNFGDPASGSSNVSTQQNAIHTFSSPGTYTVCLSILGDSCSSTFCRYVLIPDSVNYHQIYGQVFAGNFPLQLGLAMIFSLDTNQNTVPYVNVSTIDSSGVYYFTQVPDGNYVINAIPIEPGGYLPTYYGDVITWEQATQIPLGTADNPYNIHLIPAGAYNPGGGSASGQINTGKIANSLIDKITMTLLDVNYHPISFSRVNTAGAFDFPSLDYGTYYLHPEMAGISSDIVKIEITPAKPHVDVIMTFTGTHILGTGDITAGLAMIMVYPNPVIDQMTLSINLPASNVIQIDICTITGQVVYSTLKPVLEGQTKIIVPFSELNEGMYIVKIHSEDGINVVKRVIKSR